MRNHVMDIGTVEMLTQEEGIGTQVARGGRVVEHCIEHLGARHLVLVKERLGQFLGSKPLERIAQEHATQRSAAALVTQDEAQRGHILHNLVAVIETGIATSSQDAGQTRPTHQESARSTQQVAHHRHGRLELRHQ